ncbi:hypothetical protein GQX73_g2825 [Xylaria multiplex]|uniref:Reverse transcriptase Ty1/copia-type domain-containing protein n=1 Tax=Xylaria multiplex TaxID=323545 RepID=A0A7C8MQ09_9PEZI|nr:hypothetical protein GQX73_g2825 [Xylaria multiplex]
MTLITSAENPIQGETALRDQYDYPAWIQELQVIATLNELWDAINPDAPDCVFNPKVAPPEPSRTAVRDELIERRNQQHFVIYQLWLRSPVATRGKAPEPPSEELSDAEIQPRLDELRKDYPTIERDFKKKADSYIALYQWVYRTVDRSIMGAVTTKLIIGESINLQQTVRALRDMLAPTRSARETQAQYQYQEALSRARNGGIKPNVWFATWNQAYLNATALNLPEVNGVLATRNFLEAIRVRMAPDWARQQIASLTMDEQLGRPLVSLEQYARVFSTLVHEELSRGKHNGGGIFATLGGRSQGQSQNQRSGRGGSAKQGNSASQGHQCPCLPDLSKTHFWLPHVCGRLQFAITGASDRKGIKLSPEQVERIKERWGFTRWTELRQKIAKEGWSVTNPYGKGGSNKGASEGKWPDPNLTCTVIDRTLVKGILTNPGIYTTLGYGLHPLSESTVIDNCGALHLVNTKELLVPGSFVLSEDGESVDAGTTSFPILGRGKRIISNVLASAKGKDTANLTLENVALVEGFHVNIVSEARLRDSGIWYCGLDCSLRYGTLQNSVLMKQLTRKLNLVFLEYKPISIYSSSSLVVRPQVYGTLKRFERWVMRQYRLPICKMRSDRERAVISERGKTDFQRWSKDEGIDLELPPAYVKEPVGGSERAGQEVITKAIKMLQGAGLPNELWTEAVHAAAWLHNRSPSEAHDLHAPVEVLLNWFRQYHRWYSPESVISRTADLRPDWSNTWAVWIPQLDEVITTRDVRFDEEIFYQKEQEKLAIKIDTGLVRSISLPLPDPEEIPETTNVWETTPPTHLEPEPEDPPSETGGDPSPNDHSAGSQPEEHESGVGASEEQDKGDPGALRDQPHGLMTPQETPEPEWHPDRTREQIEAAEQPGNEPGTAAEQSGDREPHQEVHSTGTEEAANDPPEDPAEDCIVVGGQPAQQQPAREIRTSGVRSSRRLRGEPPENVAGNERNAGVFTAFTRPIYGEQEINTPDDPSWINFLNTFMPDQLEAIHQGDREHKTLHAVFAAAVNQHKAERLGAAPQQPRIHRNDLVKPPPKAWKDLAKHPLGDQFRENAAKEIARLQKMNAMIVIPREEAEYEPLPLKWVFAYKFDEKGYLETCKARLVARGDLQVEDTLQSTYAATLAAKTFRIMMAIAAQFDLEVKQFDVISAFLNAARTGEKPVACELPDGFKQESKAALLNRALYGLRDSPLLWYKEFASTLKKLQLIPSPEEPCLFYSPDRKVYIIFYVDDFLVMYHKKDEKEAQRVISGIKGAYELKEQGDVSWFLGIRYIEKIAQRFGLADNSWIPITPLPMKELEKYLGTATKVQIKVFQERVGSILYTAIMIRPDVAYAVAQLSKHLTNPSPEHLAMADQVIRYLYHTRFLGITYGHWEQSAQALLIAGDASFGDDKETRRSSHGYIMFLFGGAICWKATRQSTVATSTTEAEINVLGLTGVETMALKRLFRDIDLELGQEWTIFSDNTQAIRLVVGENERINTRLRHVDIQNMWVKQEHRKGSFKVVYLPTDQMPADGLTKNLPRAQYEHFRALINLQDASHLVQKRSI